MERSGGVKMWGERMKEERRNDGWKKKNISQDRDKVG